LIDIVLETQNYYAASYFAQTLTSLPGGLMPEEGRVFDHLIEMLKKADIPSYKTYIAQALVAVPGRLPDDQADDCFNILLHALNTRDINEGEPLAEAITRIRGVLPKDLARDAFNESVSALMADEFNDTALVYVARMLPVTEKDAAFEQLFKVLAKHYRSYIQLTIAQAIAAVPGTLSAEQEGRLLSHLADGLKRDNDSDDKLNFAHALASASSNLPATLSRQCVDNLLHSFREVLSAKSIDTVRGRWLFELVSALSVMRGELRSDEAQALFEDLFNTLDKAEGIDSEGYMVRGLASVPGKLTPAQRNVLIQILKWPTCIGDVQVAILKKLEEEAEGKFDGDLSKAAQWAMRMGFDVKSPPRRNLRKL
jgi:predicted lipid carrier protein YhbT